MTPTAYFTALIAKSFGWERRNKRMAEASNEMGLLREAEYQLGLRIWDKIGDIEELSVEYWNMRKHTSELAKKSVEMDALNETLTDHHKERTAILNDVTEEQLALEQERTQLMNDMESLARERDAVIRRARDIRRAHEGCITKIEVLERDKAAPAVIESAKTEIENLKNEFRDLKKIRQNIANDLESGDRKIDEINAKVAEIRAEMRERAAVVFQKMGDVNRELSVIRSECGTIEVQIRQLLAEVGRYVSRYDKRDPECGKVAKHEKTMVEVMRMLRVSISMNHKLADFK